MTGMTRMTRDDKGLLEITRDHWDDWDDKG